MDKPSTSTDSPKCSLKKLLQTKRPLTQAELNNLAEHWFSDDELSENDATDSDDEIYAPSDIGSETDSSDTDAELETENEVNHSLSHTAPTVSSAWNDVTGINQKNFIFSGDCGIKMLDENHQYSPTDCFLMLVSDDILQLMTTETNKNVAQQVNDQMISRQSRLRQWSDTTVEEMKKFLGLLIWMGLDKKPSIRHYWSKKLIYTNNVANKVMSRNHFELLLRYWHFADNTQQQGTPNKLYKIQPLLDKLVKNFKTYKVPGSVLAVDETMVPFRGRLRFRQYIPGKKHKYGVKLFKLCCPEAYTYNVEIYQGKSNLSGTDSLSKAVVLRLCDDYLDSGRTIITDNFYTSIQLAESLLTRETHLIGTVRKNRKGIPKCVITEKLKKGELVGKENDQRIVVLKWKDQRDVFALSTCNNLDIVQTGKTNKNGVPVCKPKLILDYNHGKTGIDVSDQLASYATAVRKSIRWYHKVACELLLGTAVVNAYIIYKSLDRRSNMSIVDFRESICMHLMNLEENTSKPSTPAVSLKRKHELGVTDLVDNRNRKLRRRCVHCYEKLREEGKNCRVARDETKKVNTVCVGCENRPSVCLDCYNTIHVNLRI